MNLLASTKPTYCKSIFLPAELSSKSPSTTPWSRYKLGRHLSPRWTSLWISPTVTILTWINSAVRREKVSKVPVLVSAVNCRATCAHRRRGGWCRSPRQILDQRVITKKHSRPSAHTRLRGKPDNESEKGRRLRRLGGISASFVPREPSFLPPRRRRFLSSRNITASSLFFTKKDESTHRDSRLHFRIKFQFNRENHVPFVEPR